MQAVIRLLANREHAKQELFRKLSKRCDKPEWLVQVIDRCEEQGYQTAQRYYAIS